MPVDAFNQMIIYKTMFPVDFKIKIKGLEIELRDINLYPPAKTTQIALANIDK